MRTILTLVAIVVAASTIGVVAAGAAGAGAPIQFSFTQPITFTDTETCGFPITVNLVDTVVGRVFLDSQGEPQSATIEQGVVGTDSANGITTRDATHYVDFFDSLGNNKEVGLTFHVLGDGVVLQDAGYILFNSDGSVAFVHGRHPFLEGDTASFCAALTPH